MKKFIVLCLFVACVLGCGKKEEIKFQGVSEEHDYVQIGMNFLAQKDIARAIASFDQAIKVDPQNPDKYIILGRVYVGLKNYSRAIDTFTAATAVDSFNGQAYYLIAVSRMLRNQEGDEELAIEAAKKSLLSFRKNEDKKGFVLALALLKKLSEEEARAITQETQQVK